MPIKTVLFDADDTLIQTMKTAFQVHKKTAKQYYNIDLIDNDLRSIWGIPFPQMVSKLYKDAEDFESIYKNILKVKENIKAEAHLYAISTLKELKKLYNLGLVTASGNNIVRIYLEDGGIDLNLFDIFQTAEDTDIHKPDPRVFDNILEKLAESKITRNEVVYVGDSVQDYKAAKGAGINFVAVTTGISNKNDFEKLELDPEFILSDLQNLPEKVLLF